MVKYNS